MEQQDIESSEDLATWIDGEIQEAKRRTSEWRTTSKECYSFYSGDQWDEEDKAILEEQGRPAVVFNRVARTINAIAGLEVQNRQEVRYIPREVSDTAVNDLLTAATKWVRDNCDAEDEESEAFQDVLICGMGWTDTRLDYDVDPDGEIIVERDDPMLYYWDVKARKRNLDDTRWRAKVHQMSEKDIKDRWPDADIESSAESLLDDEETTPHDATPPFYDGKSKGNNYNKPREVLEFQWYDTVCFYRVQSNTGEIMELDEEKYQTMLPAIQGMGLPSVKQKKRVYKVVYKAGKTILEQRELESQAGFTLNCITGMRDRNMGMWFGLVFLMLDPQRWANKWLSQIMHILNSNSKGGLLAEKDAFDNPRKAEKEWAEPNSITWMRAGGIGKVQQKQISQMPTGIEGLLRYALESINDVPGVNSELLGLAERQQAGVLEMHRKQAGVTMLAVIFDSLRRYRKEQGRVMADMIRNYISDGRLIRIVGEQGSQVIPLMRDKMAMRYDVVVDDAPSSPNMKEKTYAVMSEILPVLMQQGVKPPPDIMDYLPLPDSLVQKFKQGMQPDPNAPPPPEVVQAQLQQQELQLKAQDSQAKAQESQAKMQADMQTKAVEAQLAAKELQLKEQELALKAREQSIKEYEAQTDRMVAEAQIMTAQTEPVTHDDTQDSAITVISQQIQQLMSQMQQPQQAPVTVVVEKGGNVRKEMAIQAPSGQVYTGVITESEGEE